MAINESQPHGEALRHAHQCVIDRTITMRVELSHHLADDASALHMSFIGT